MVAISLGNHPTFSVISSLILEQQCVKYQNVHGEKRRLKNMLLNLPPNMAVMPQRAHV